MSIQVQTPYETIEIDGATAGTASLAETEQQVWELTVTPAGGEPLRIWWRLPAVQIVGMWNSGLYRDRSLRADWAGGMHSHATVNAPVVCLFGAAGENRLTFACSEALQPVEMRAGVVEETGAVLCEVRVAPTGGTEPIRIRLDHRTVPWSRALTDVSDWWAGMPLHQPAPVPDVARWPMYSTWYSFHQAMTPEPLLEQCRRARELGCEAIIVDDGWQTDDSSKGYSYCGDWEPAASKFPDMRRFVEQVHELGMKVLLWYAVPWVGPNTRAWGRFQNKTLRHVEPMQASVLDPRYPEVRRHLIDTFARGVREWGLDGLKLDFVDRFNEDPPTAPPAAGMDHESVHLAADRLLSDVMAELRRLNPDIMIEFRQRYIGPLMRKYGNLFRAGDCPYDAVQNRVRTIDVRMLAGSTATHADMLMWHADEPVESAARQLLNVLFSVPQISVRLDRIPEDHRQMLRFWLGFWNEQRDLLLDGELSPHAPELLYPVVTARKGDRQVTAVYGDTVVRLAAPLPRELLLINAAAHDRLVIESPAAATGQLRTFDACGRASAGIATTLPAGPRPLSIAPSGLAHLSFE